MKHSDGKRRPTILAILLGGRAHGRYLTLNARTKTVHIPVLQQDGFGQLTYERMPRLFAEGGVWKFIPKEA